MALRHISYTVAVATASTRLMRSLDLTRPTRCMGNTFWKTETHARQAARRHVLCHRKEPWCFGMEFTLRHVQRHSRRHIAMGRCSARQLVRINSGGVQNHWQYLYELVTVPTLYYRSVSAMHRSVRRQSKASGGEARFLRAMAIFACCNAGEESLLRRDIRHQQTVDKARQSPHIGPTAAHTYSTTSLAYRHDFPWHGC